MSNGKKVYFAQPRWASAAFTRVLRFIRIRIVLVLLRVYYYFFFFDAFNIASLSRTMAFFGLMDLSAFDVVVVKPVFFFLLLLLILQFVLRILGT